MFATPVAIRTQSPATTKVLVWDMPVGVFHSLTVLSFAGANLTDESERWRLLHIILGYTMGGLVLFHIVWGVIDTLHARFSDFVHGPACILAYSRGSLHGHPADYVGHNRASALAIMVMLVHAVALTASGWARYNDVGGDALEEMHEAAASIMVELVRVHVAAALLSSYLHHENLIAAMFTGCKQGTPEDGIWHAWRSVATLILVAMLGCCWLQWRCAPPADKVQSVPVQQAIERWDKLTIWADRLARRARRANTNRSTGSPMTHVLQLLYLMLPVYIANMATPFVK